MVSTRIAVWGAGIALGAGIGCSTSSPAYAYPYDRKKVAAYAKKFACNNDDDKSCRNPDYVSFGNDCVNFVSQAMRYGGMPMQKIDNFPDWYYTSRTDQGLAWINVLAFKNFMIWGTRRAEYWAPASMRAAYTPAMKGDVYMYDWGKGYGYTHVSIATAWGKFVTTKDDISGMRYSAVTGGYGDKIAQHSTDRDGAPWNWGYWTETNQNRRRLMKTVIIHFEP